MKFIIATNNKNKVLEFKRMLLPLGIEVISQGEAGIDIEVVEDADTFEGNAFLKAKAIFDISGLPTIADDSGLCVYALNNAPGVYSARYGGKELNDKQRYEKLLEEMKNVEEQERGARFVCCISLVLSDVKHFSFTGVCEGRIGHKPKGENGFGYDPIFMVDDNGNQKYEESFSSISDKKKDQISHRGKALRLLVEEFGKMKEIK